MPKNSNLPIAPDNSAGKTRIPNNRADFLTLLGLPNSTTDAELNVILEANGGATVPLKESVFPALLAFTMREGAIPEREARQQLAQRFPSLTPPDSGTTGEATGSLRDQLLALYKLPPTATDADIAAAAEIVQRENAEEKARREQEAADELLIAKKTDVGLTRAQAVAVIARQRHHDAFVKEQRDKRRPRLVEIIQSSLNDIRAARHLVREEFPYLDSGEFNALVKELKNTAPAT